MAEPYGNRSGRRISKKSKSADNTDREIFVKKVCMCVPTKDRPEMLREVLEYEAEYYQRAGIDIAIFDSSEGDDTQSLVADFTARGFENISYHRTDPEECIDYKIISIWKECRFLREYRYIWLISDSISVYPDALNEIDRYLEEDHTLIRLPVEGSGAREDLVTTDVNEWFSSCSKGMGHMASTIMNSELLDDDIDWETLKVKYVGGNDIHSQDHGFFFTVGFYLERISKTDHFNGVLIGNRRKWRRDSPIKQGKSYWEDLVFEAWAKSYPETILKSPEIYRNKPEVIRGSDNILFGRFERQSLIGFRIRGLFSKEEVERYGEYWKYVSTLTQEELLEIAETPIEVLKHKYGEDYGNVSDWKKNLLDIENRINGRNLIIYGAGLYGEYVISQLLEDGFAEQIKGIAVSDAAENVEKILDIPVRGIDQYEDIRKEALVIISTLPDTALKIKNTLQDKGYENIVLLF